MRLTSYVYHLDIGIIGEGFKSFDKAAFDKLTCNEKGDFLTYKFGSACNDEGFKPLLFVKTVGNRKDRPII